MLSYKGVWKRYSQDYVLKDVNLVLGEGEAVLVMGPNGSGKTTLLKLGVGLIRPSRGEVKVGEIDVRSPEAKRFLGYLPHSPPLYLDLTVRENLKYYAGLHEMEDLPEHVLEALKGFGLDRFLDRKVRELSYGWRRRVDVLRAIIGLPRVLLMDEPFSGLDLNGRNFMVSLMEGLKSEGTSMIFTTPYGEVPAKADRVLEIRGGNLVELKG